MKAHCGYCYKAWGAGHTCPQQRDALARIDQMIENMKATYGPNPTRKRNQEPETSEQMRQRAKGQRNMVTGIKLSGGRVRPEYDGI